MNLNFKKIISGLICFWIFLILPQLILAQSPVKVGLDITAKKAGVSTETDLPAMLGRAINYFFGILGVVFLTVVLIGGYMWMTAGGNEEKVGKAKAWVINGINGMIVVFLAYVLVFTILSALKAAVGG